MELKDSFQLVAAIDFGTTYSGYAYSTRHDFETDPLTIHLMTWSAGSGGLTSQKTSTCVLFKPDQTFHSFGYNAEDNYNELVMDEEHKDWFFFRRFKMDLYSDNINRYQMLKTEDGKKMSAIKVISAVLSFLKGHLIQKIVDRAVDIPESEIRWVVTVPAIWTDPAKQMMREAAEMAGIGKYQLILALEPEAASILCRYLPEVHLLSGDCTDKVETFRSGSKYMIFDAGGGTIDITVHEVLKGGFLKEVHAANGGGWGGTKVDEAFEDFLESIVGKDAFQYFKSNEIPSVIDLHRNFEVKKKTITVEDAGMKTTLTVPILLMETFREYYPDKPIPDAIEAKHCSSDVEWKRDKLRLSHKKTLTLFEESFKHITKHVSDILSKPEVKDCEAILMVGGYSECPLLQDAIRTIAGSIRLIVPSDASLAVLKGAVINGHRPDTVSERICKYTYGIGCRMPFKDGVHKQDYRVLDERGVFGCEHVFSSFVIKGTHVKFGTSSLTKTYSVVNSDQTGIRFRLYASTSVNPMYVTDASCQTIGELTLDMPDTTLGLERGANAALYFGGSEIELKAVDKHTVRSSKATALYLPMHTTKAENPDYVSNDGCQKIGEMTLKMPDTSLGKDRGANVTMYFGGSEIEVTAVDIHTGRKISACVDILG